MSSGFSRSNHSIVCCVNKKCEKRQVMSELSYYKAQKFDKVLYILYFSSPVYFDFSKMTALH